MKKFFANLWEKFIQWADLDGYVSALEHDKNRKETFYEAFFGRKKV